jgi:hypothetical protein
MIERSTLFPVIAGICVANGIFSPYLAIALQVVPVLMPELFPKTVGWALFFSSIFIASGTLLAAGVPAALFERLFERNPEGTASMWIWLIGVTLLSLPALEAIGGAK